MDEGSGTVIANAHPWTAQQPNVGARFADPPGDPAWVAAGRFGSALRFSAIALNDTDRIYATILHPNDSMSVGAHSIEMWVNPMPTFPHDLELFSTTGGQQSGRMDYLLKFVRTGGQGSFHLQLRSGGFGETMMSPMVELGTYHHVVMSYQPGTAPLLFVDGTSVRASQTVSGTVENLVFQALTLYEGDADELHLTFHPFTEQELLDRWCPP